MDLWSAAGVGARALRSTLGRRAVRKSVGFGYQALHVRPVDDAVREQRVGNVLDDLAVRPHAVERHVPEVIGWGVDAVRDVLEVGAVVGDRGGWATA